MPSSTWPERLARAFAVLRGAQALAILPAALGIIDVWAGLVLRRAARVSPAPAR